MLITFALVYLVLVVYNWLAAHARPGPLIIPPNPYRRPRPKP